MNRVTLASLAAVLFAATLFGAGVAGGASADPTVVASAALAEGETLVGPVMIELQGPPATEVYATSGASAAKAQKESNESAQAALTSAIAASGADAEVLYTVATAYNGVAVQVDSAEDAAALADLPGVKALHAIPLAEIDNASSVNLIGAYQAWEAHGKTGDGMSIAVIDTGVDYVHTGFGGPGTSAAYTTANSPANNLPATDSRSPFSIPGLYPSAKVVGGHDFAGDNYNALGTPAQQIPRPDRNPMDCNSHGSHVAGSAAGYGVNADGSTYTGAYNASLDSSSMRIGPGTAPNADVYALRIFGCAGSTTLTTAAINWAVDPNGDGDPSDHVDVINMSLGSDFGTSDDPSAAASDQAVLAGAIVVASAGNAQDTYYVTGSPGTSTRTLSVAWSTDATDVADAFKVNSPASIAGFKGGSVSVNFNWMGSPILPLTRDVYYPAENRSGCAVYSAAEAARIAGKILLVDWRDPGNPVFPCGSTQRANNATTAGAHGVIMADNVPYLDTAIGGNAAIPAMYTTSTVGDELKAGLAAGPVSVTFDRWFNFTKITTPGRADMMGGTSRGPRARGAALKPDISAPGHGIHSVAHGTGTMGSNKQGTSMAAPHMAGVMALLKSLHPDWSVEELKALAMNTANHDLFLNLTTVNGGLPRYGVGRAGAGRVDVPQAMANDVVAYSADVTGAVGVSFGALEVRGPHKEERTVKVVNHGSAAKTYTVGYDAITSIPGVEYSFPETTTVTVPAGGSATFMVRLSANAAQMQNTRDASAESIQAGNPRQWISEAGGLITLTPQGGGIPLRVPVYATARPASKMGATGDSVDFTSSTTKSIKLRGQDVNTGTEPLGWVSKVSAFELAHTSGQATLPAAWSPSARNADLSHVGVAMNAARNSIYWGFATHGEWAAPVTDAIFSIQIDRDRNATVDATLVSGRLTHLNQASDVWATQLGTTLSFVNVFNSNVNTAGFDNNVVVFPTTVAALALPTGTTRFNYRVIGQSRFWGTVETTPWLTYDVAAPGLAFSAGIAGTAVYPDLQGGGFDATLNGAAYSANGSQGLLLLHHFNEFGNRAEVLNVIR